MALGLGGGRGSWLPMLLEANDHLAPGHRHSGSNSAVDLATPVQAQRLFRFSYTNIDLCEISKILAVCMFMDPT